MTDHQPTAETALVTLQSLINWKERRIATAHKDRRPQWNVDQDRRTKADLEWLKAALERKLGSVV